MENAIAGTVSAALWLVVVRRASMARRPGTQRALWCSLLALALAESVRIPALHAYLSDSLGVAGAAVLKQTFTLAAAAGVLTLLRKTVGATTSARRLIMVTAAAAMVMALPLLITGSSTTPGGLVSQANTYTSSWSWLVHWTAVLAYLGWTLVAATHLCVHYGRMAGPGALRTGLYLIAAGTCTGMLVVVLKIAVIASGLLDDAELFSGIGESGEAALIATSLLLIITGASWERVVAAWNFRAEAARCRRATRALRPLWTTVCNAVPHVALSTRSAGSLLGTRLGPRQRLYRDVVEIRDGLMALERYAGPEVRSRALETAQAQGTADPEARAEALWLAHAVVAKNHHAPHARTTPRPDPPRRRFLDEVTWLQRVAVAHAQASMDDEAGSRPEKVKT